MFLEQYLNTCQGAPKSLVVGERLPLSDPGHLIFDVVTIVVQLEGILKLLVPSSHGVFQLAVPGEDGDRESL